MWKILFTSLITLLFTTGAMAQDLERDELIDLANFAIESNLTIEQWEVTIKEKMDKDRLLNIINMLKDSHLATVTEDENVIKYAFGDNENEEDVSENYYVIIPKDNRTKPELIATIKGVIWDESTKKDYQTRLLLINQQSFTSSAKRYTCLNLINGAIIKDMKLFNKINEQFDLTHVSTQFDTVKQSTNNKVIYGYTPLWKQKVEVMGKPMNIQMAMKNTENGNSKITVGTPILINEY